MAPRLLFLIAFALPLALSLAVPILRRDEPTDTSDNRPHSQVVVRSALTTEQVRQAISRGQYEMAKYKADLERAKARARALDE